MLRYYQCSSHVNVNKCALFRNSIFTAGMDQPLFGEARPRDKYLNLGLIIATVALYIVRLFISVQIIHDSFHTLGDSSHGIHCWIFT